MDSIKDIVRSSVKVPEFDKNLKMTGGHIGRNIVKITIKMKTNMDNSLYVHMKKRKKKTYINLNS